MRRNTEGPSMTRRMKLGSVRVLTNPSLTALLPFDRLSNVPHIGPARRHLTNLADMQLERMAFEFTSAPTNYGFTISGTTADIIQRRIYKFGVWEPNLSAWVSNFLRTGDVAVDVGANIGYFTLLMSTSVGASGKVYAFEPVPGTYEILRCQLEENERRNVEAMEIAASDHSGHVEMFVGPSSNSGASSTMIDVNLTSIGTVPMARGMDLIPQSDWDRVRLIKVDIEGDEFAALRGLEGVLKRMSRGSAVVVEVAPKRMRERGETVREFTSFMDLAGFGDRFTIDNSYEADAYRHARTALPRHLTNEPDDMTDIIFVK